jgi:hypothetical protein
MEQPPSTIGAPKDSLSTLRKRTATQAIPETELPSDFVEEDNDNEVDAAQDNEPVIQSKLAPQEIFDYVNSLKSLAKYWYSSFFPSESEFSDEEILWLDKLNRIGIGYFRPLVAAALSTEKTSTETERIELFKAVERFIFVTFRLGGFQSNYQSSVYYNSARDLLNGTEPMEEITEYLHATVNEDMDGAMKAFVARMARRFDAGDGFYGWRDLRYFLFEYELDKAIAFKRPPKLSWRLFSQSEKEKVTIEHILPQTPSKWYWRNAFRPILTMKSRRSLPHWAICCPCRRASIRHCKMTASPTKSTRQAAAEAVTPTARTQKSRWRRSRIGRRSTSWSEG